MEYTNIKSRKDVRCPKCNKLLLKVGSDATGTFYPYCKRCGEVQITLEPKRS